MGDVKGCGGNCARWMLIILNFIFWLAGSAMLGIGIWIMIDKNVAGLMKFVGLIDHAEFLMYGAYIFLVVGAFVFIVGLCGCCGALMLNKLSLGFYIGFLVIVVIAEIAVGVLAYIMRDKLLEVMEKQGRKHILNYGKGDKVFDEAVDAVQQGLDCCGMLAVDDFKESVLFTGIKKQNVPWSCCVEKDKSKLFWDRKKENVNKCWKENLSEWEMPTANYFPKNCKDGLTSFVKEKSSILIGIGIGVAFLEILGFIFGVCLCQSIRDEDDDDDDEKY